MKNIQMWFFSEKPFKNNWHIYSQKIYPLHYYNIVAWHKLVKSVCVCLFYSMNVHTYTNTSKKKISFKFVCTRPNLISELHFNALTAHTYPLTYISFSVIMWRGVVFFFLCYFIYNLEATQYFSIVTFYIDWYVIKFYVIWNVKW